jgi:HSP20 family molecular chaperone IbpA
VGRYSATWHPAINVYRSDSHYLVCLELAGIEAGTIHLLVQPCRLLIRGRRLPPEPPGGDVPELVTREIHHGPFERVVVFPLEVDLSAIAAGQAGGLVWIQLPLLMPV